MVPFSLEKEKKLEINSKVTHFKCSKANKLKLRCSQNNQVDQDEHRSCPVIVAVPFLINQ